MIKLNLIICLAIEKVKRENENEYSRSFFLIFVTKIYKLISILYTCYNMKNIIENK